MQTSPAHPARTATPAGAAPSKKQVLYLLDSPDPDAGAVVGSYLSSLFKGAKVEPATPDDSLELTSKVEKKYMAAQTVEYGLQVRDRAAGEGRVLPRRRTRNALHARPHYNSQHAALPPCRPSACPWGTARRT